MISRAFRRHVSRCSIDFAFHADDDDDDDYDDDDHDDDDHVDDIDGAGVTIQTANFETMAHREPLFRYKVEKGEKGEEPE